MPSTRSCSANLATATGGAVTTRSGTNPNHGNVHNAIAIPSRSAGPRPRPGSTNARSAGESVKNRNNSSRPISGNSRSRANSSSANTRVATKPTSHQPTALGAKPTRVRLHRRPNRALTNGQPRLRHIRWFFGGYYRNPYRNRPQAGESLRIPKSAIDGTHSFVSDNRGVSQSELCGAYRNRAIWRSPVPAAPHPRTRSATRHNHRRATVPPGRPAAGRTP